MGFGSVRHWRRLWEDLKKPSNRRPALFFAGCLIVCIGSIHFVARHQVPKVIDRKVEMVSGLPTARLILSAVSSEEIKEITLIDWRNHKRWTTEDKSLIVEDSHWSENHKELKPGQMVLELRPLSEVKLLKDKQATYEIEIKLTSGKILWDYVILPPFSNEHA
jgi:hypothetical protein